MNVALDNQIRNSIVVQSKTTTLKRRIQRKYQGFQTPFAERRVLLVLMDTLLVLLAILGAFLIWGQIDQLEGMNFSGRIRSDWYWFPILLGGWWGLALLNDLYDVPSSGQKVTTLLRLLAVTGLALLIYLVVFFLLRASLPRIFFLSFLVLLVGLITAWRWTYAVIFGILRYQHRVLIVGKGKRGQQVADILINKASQLNYVVLGYIDDDPNSTCPIPSNLPVWGNAEELPFLTEQLDIQEVILATEQDLDKDLFHWLSECQANGIQISLMPNIYEKINRSIPIESIDPAWALYTIQGQALLSRHQLLGKRLMDIGLSLVGMVLFAPFFPLLALAIWLDSPGSVFYRQIRSGRAGRSFFIYKFRTMTANAEEDGQARWATKSDPRITRVGHFLRKTRLDELPQLINILSGEMSFVGPRPERPEFIEMLEKEVPFYRTRLLIKPGLTGWAQVHYDYGNTIQDALVKLQYDFYYLRYWSLWLDIYIIFRTIKVAFQLKGT